MSISSVKRIASRILRCGGTRVRIMDVKKAGEALTADDVRALIKEGVVVEVPAISVGRGKARSRITRRRAGRGRGEGSLRGSATQDSKEKWIAKVRSQRRVLRSVRHKLAGGAYRKVYSMVKGNFFRDKKQLLAYLKSNSLYSEGRSNG